MRSPRVIAAGGDEAGRGCGVNPSDGRGTGHGAPHSPQTHRDLGWALQHENPLCPHVWCQRGRSPKPWHSRDETGNDPTMDHTPQPPQPLLAAAPAAFMSPTPFFFFHLFISPEIIIFFSINHRAPEGHHQPLYSLP